MQQVNLIITYKKDKKKVTATLTDVNSNVTNEKMLTLVYKLNEFTKNMYSSTSKSVKEELL